MKFRLPGRRSAETSPDPATDLTAQQVATVGKGRPTPKRSEAQGRRQGPPPPPPATRKEAYKRTREQQAANRGSAREAAARGDDSALPARDRGPVKRLVRDVVDTRRSPASVFLFIAAIALVSVIWRDPVVQSYTTLLMLLFFVIVIVDSFFLSRRIKQVIADKLPGHSTKGVAWYGITRSTMVRRWRFPKPQVTPGAQV